MWYIPWGKYALELTYIALFLYRYLESMEAIVKSQTKGSPYYNIVFLERLKDITERLSGSSQLVATG